MKTVAAVHTALPMVDITSTLFNEYLPNVRLINIVDDSLIQDIINAGKVSPAVARRLIGYFFAGVDAGADLIFNTCSSVGEIADIGKSLLEVPLIKIDEPMTLKAVERANAIGVLATVPTTLGPTVRFIEAKAGEIEKSVSVVERLAEGAFQALLYGDIQKHDRLVLETAKCVAEDVQMLVLAQATMARMEDTLSKETDKTVLSSPRSGVLAVKEKLGELDA